MPDITLTVTQDTSEDEAAVFADIPLPCQVVVQNLTPIIKVICEPELSITVPGSEQRNFTVRSTNTLVNIALNMIQISRLEKMPDGCVTITAVDAVPEATKKTKNTVKANAETEPATTESTV